MRYIISLVWLIFSCIDIEAQSSSFDENTWQTNDRVNSIVHDGSTVYLGGSFTMVGPSVPYGVPLDASTGLPDMTFARPNNIVRAVVSDGSGGWYIGGDFTMVGGIARNYLARINSDGSVNSWNPNMGNTVHSLALSGGILYVGGSFTTASGSGRNRIAAFDVSSGLLTSWNPGASGGNVLALAVNGNTVYAGGAFTTIGGSSRIKIAALDATINTNNATSWNPIANISGTVNTLTISGDLLYVGGAFTTFGASGATTTRNRIAAFNLSTGALTSWNPSATGGNVNTIVVNGSKIYVGGLFTNIGGQNRNKIAELDSTTGNASSWNPNADNTVSSLLVSGTTVYAGGDFATIGGQTRPRIAALDATSGNATSWNPKAGSSVLAMALQSGSLYVGGSFTIIGGKVRNRLAAIDALTGQANDWDPDVLDGTVNAVLLSGGVLYAGGSFTTVGGLLRSKIAAIDPVTAVVSSTWNPNANSDVACLAANGDTIYAGGNFTTIGGQTRNSIAALRASDGTAFTSWNANVNRKVNAIAVSGGRVYFGGQFFGTNSVNGNTTRNYLAAVNTSDGTVISNWNPNPTTSVEVFAVAVNNGLVYAAGNFATIGDSSRTYFAELLAGTGKATAWNPKLSNTVSALAFSGSMVYAARSFTSAAGVTRNNVTGLYLNVKPVSATPWDPIPDNYVYSVAVTNDKVYIGGVFKNVNSLTRSYFAAFPINSVNWGGSNGGDWGIASNWAPGLVPSGSLDVAISMGSPSLNQDYSLPSGKSLTLSGTGSLTVAAGKTLTLAGTADFGSRPVTFKSSAIGTAALGQVTGTLTGATSVTVERYIPAGRKWRFLCAPLKGSSNNSIFYHWQNNDVPYGATGVEIWGPGGDANPSSSNTGLAPGGSASMRSYDAGWQNVTNTNTSNLFDATTNNGYALFLTGPYNNGSTTYIGNAGSLPSAAATTLSATGTLITGDHTKSFTAASPGQYFLVANPYASPVNPASFTTAGTVNRTNLDNTLYMWDAKPGNAVNRGLGRYVAYDISTGQYSNGGAGTGFADNTVQIQSGQSFFVRATNAGSASLVFRESSKGSSGAHDMFGSSTQSVPATVHLMLQQDGAHVDGARAFFHAGASASLDALDGYKLMNSTDNLGLRREGRTLVFEHRPVIKANDTLLTCLTQLQGGAYRLRVVLEGFKQEDGLQAELVDRHLKQRILLSLTDTTHIDFTVTADSATSGERFQIVFTKAASNGGGTAEPGEAVRMNPYPNPAIPGLPVRVDLDAKRAPWDLQLIDAMGRTVWKETVKDGGRTQMQIDMSRMAKGVYQLLMTDAKGEQVRSRVVKQ